MIAVRVTAPAEPAVHLAEAKQAFRVDHDLDDVRIAALIQAATERFDGVNGYLGRALVEQTWRISMPGFLSPIRLPLAPVKSVERVAWVDDAGTEWTVDPETYIFAVDETALYLEPGTAWPAVSTRRRDAVRVEVVAGYGGTEDVPEAIRQAIILWARYLYDGNDLDRAAADALAEPYRRVV